MNKTDAVETEIRVPPFADVASARLATWLKRQGDVVTKGEPIAEFETDKALVEVEAPASGTLHRIAVAAGTDAVAVGSLIGVIVDEHTGGAAEEAAAAREEIAEPEARPRPASTAPLTPDERVTLPDAGATPLAERMATLAGIDVADLVATKRGRLVKADIDALLPERGNRVPSTRRTFTESALSAARQVTGQRLLHAKQTIPHFYLEMDCRMDALLAVREQLNSRSADIRISVTDLVTFAVVRALRRVPTANSAWVDDSLRIYEEIDIAIAVNTPRGLLTPVVRGCAGRSLTDLSRESKRLFERARAARLQPDEYTGGTFTISNLGMFGTSRVTPIINPPQSCILGVGAVEERPVVHQGGIVPGHVMTCTLAADHRAVDGATGAELLTHIRRFLEEPVAAAFDF